MSERNHFYLYYVATRRVETVPATDDDGNIIDGKTKKVTHWDETTVEACNIWEVAGKLKRHIDDVRYFNKVIIK